MLSVTCQVPVSDIKYHVSVSSNNISSTDVTSQVSESGVKYNMSICPAIGVKIAITKYETMIAKHEATQEMYSPKTGT